MTDPNTVPDAILDATTKSDDVFCSSDDLSCSGNDAAKESRSMSDESRCVVGLEGIPGQGPHMLIVLRVRGRQITEARFSTYGCPAAVACGQFVTEQIEGRSWEDTQVADLSEDSIIAGIGQMPLGREHCPSLAVKALRHALAQLSEDASLSDPGCEI